MKSVRLLLLLVGIALADNQHENVVEDVSEPSLSSVEEIEQSFLQLAEQIARIVIMDSENLRTILLSQINLQFTFENHTTYFFTEFNQFVIPFSWEEPEKNDIIMKLVAEYNRNLPHNKTNQVINLWVSFQPRNDDISRDIEVLTHAINKANSIYSETVIAVSLDYGLLQLDRESVLLVNHEIQKVSQKLEELSDKTIYFVLQLDIRNCKGQVGFLSDLELNKVFLVLLSNPRKAPVLENERDMYFVMMSHFSCFVRVKGAFLAVNAHLSVQINVEDGSYYYNLNMVNRIKNRTTILPLTFWSEVNNKRDSSVNVKQAKMLVGSQEWNEWLRQPAQFSKAHFGAVLSVEDYVPNRVFDYFDKIIIEIREHSPNTQEFLQQAMTDLHEYSTSVEQASNEENKREISLLIVITRNDFEMNKKQIDDAVWAFAYGNQIAAGTVKRLMFDWMSCGVSALCSGYPQTHPNSIYRMHPDIINMVNYTKFALKKMTSAYAAELVLFGDVDAIVYSTVGQRNKRATTRSETAVKTHARGLKINVSEKDLQNSGAAKMFSIVTAQMSPLIEGYRAGSKPFAYYYVKVTGCNDRKNSNATQLAEFVVFYQKLNNWAVINNMSLYVNAGIENLADCELKISLELNCTCGWWVTTNVTEENLWFSENILDKKTLVVNLEKKRNSRSTSNEKSTSVGSSKVFYWILVPILFVGVLITVVAVLFVFHYKSKYILTREEVANFLRGRLQTNRNNGSATREVNGSPENEPYNSTRFELPSSSFNIDKSSCVGSGEFGTVFRAFINRAGKKVESAVKVANTRALGQSHGGRIALLGLLSEIKILAYLGKHEHIVGLLGAYTANLRKGELAIFLEFCELGSLHSYLRSIQPDRVENIGNEDAVAIALLNIVSEENMESGQNLLDSDICDELYGYCGQVACGMEYLALKNVVHADLATRNVLLTMDKVAKICDFGLSRRMYDYTEYVKQSQAPLPWRWMAPESLRRLFFNEKSDVWAFGITLWEIFTLGDEPYPGLSWQENFPAMLTRGLRLHAPRHNVRGIYSVMKRCWNVNPDARPTFSELSTELNTKQAVVD